MAPRADQEGHMVVLRDVCHPKIKRDQVQKRWLWELNALGFEIRRNIEHQAISALLQAGVVVQRTVWIAAIGIQGETFDQGGKLPLCGVKANVHAGCRATVHGV